MQKHENPFKTKKKKEKKTERSIEGHTRVESYNRVNLKVWKTRAGNCRKLMRLKATETVFI